MFADMTSLSSSNDYATIQTGYYDPTSTPQCMKFSYYMGTSQASVLQVSFSFLGGFKRVTWGPDPPPTVAVVVMFFFFHSFHVVLSFACQRFVGKMCAPTKFYRMILFYFVCIFF